MDICSYVVFLSHALRWICKIPRHASLSPLSLEAVHSSSLTSASEMRFTSLEAQNQISKLLPQIRASQRTFQHLQSCCFPSSVRHGYYCDLSFATSWILDDTVQTRTRA